MKRHCTVVIAAAVAAGIAFIAAPSQAWIITLPRAGQIGFSIQGTYGTMLESGQFGDEFGRGGVLAVRARYRLRNERAVGVSFEEFKLDSRTHGGLADSTYEFPNQGWVETRENPGPYRKSLQYSTAGADIYQMFYTRKRLTTYVQGGLGLVIHATANLTYGGTQDPADTEGTYVSAGGGAEYFVYRSWAIDASAHAMTMFIGGHSNPLVHAAVGLIYYAAY